MPDFLESMRRAGMRRVKAARSRESLAGLMLRAAGTAPPPPLARHESGFDLIAEIKLRSAAVGAQAAAGAGTPAEMCLRAARYAEAGAAAVSVLTEPGVFSGHLDHLAAAARDCPVPTVRKDFLVDPYQIFEARACGAGGALLILRMLDDALLDEMLDAAAQTGLFLLLEAFDSTDLARAACLAERAAGSAPPPLLFGVNCRDLLTLEVDLSRFERLALELPAAMDATAVRPAHVAESGLSTPADVARVAALGYDMALVGGALMRLVDPRAAVRAMIQAGRAARHSSGETRCASA